MSNNQQNSEKKQEKEDPGLTEFKESALRNCILEKALSRPEANCCTYFKGYIQQECFICLTCLQETKKRAVICLGCSIKCHDEHEIVPIGFKRNIRCDCGNTKYLIDCKLKKKNEIDYDNPGNCYNHNMENKYCYCDTEDDGNSTMIQCFFCEDWYHKEHLNIFGVKNKDKKNYGEKNLENNAEITINENDCQSEDLPLIDLVCKICVRKIKDILIGYDLKKILYGLMPEENIRTNILEEEKKQKQENLDINKVNEKDKDKPNININKEKDKEGINKDNNINKEEEEKQDKNEIILLGKKRNNPLPISQSIEEDKKEINNNEYKSNNNLINSNINQKEIENNIEKNNTNNLTINDSTKCKRKKYIEYEELLNNIILKEQNILIDCEIFLNILCRCESCQEMYKKMGLDILNNKNLYKEWENRKSFDDIINDEKFIEEVEKENPIPLESMEGNVSEFFNSKEYKELTCEQQILVRGYISELGSKLQEFISTLNHTTITVEDVYAFIKKYRDHFEDLKNK